MMLQGHATFAGKHSVTVGEQTLRFTCAVIATGGTARIPSIPGLKVVPYLTNATFFNLTELPARFGVIGAGPVGELLCVPLPPLPSPFPPQPFISSSCWHNAWRILSLT